MLRLTRELSLIIGTILSVKYADPIKDIIKQRSAKEMSEIRTVEINEITKRSLGNLKEIPWR